MKNIYSFVAQNSKVPLNYYTFDSLLGYKVSIDVQMAYFSRFLIRNM